jgi:hypothetical protein
VQKTIILRGPRAVHSVSEQPVMDEHYDRGYHRFCKENRAEPGFDASMEGIKSTRVLFIATSPFKSNTPIVEDRTIAFGFL